MVTRGKAESKGGASGARRKDRAASAPTGPTGDAFLADEDALLEIERAHPEGQTSAQIIEAFKARGVHLTEATFRKWVQVGLLPRSRRVGRKGKHQGSLGLYPPATVRRIAAVKRLMGQSLTTQDIARSLRFRDAIEDLERGVGELFRGFREALGEPDAGIAEGERKKAGQLLEQLEKQSAELVRRIGTLERRIVEPLERGAQARAFGSGASGGAGDLL